MDEAWIRETFLQLVQIDSPSLREGKVAAYVREVLQSLGFSVIEDDAGKTLGGECGNLIATLPGDAGRRRVLLLAHMDTVRPGEGVKPRVSADGVVRSDGTTVLGADDKAGITAILAAVKALVERKLPHGQVQVVFTVAEEIGLAGAKHLHPSLIASDAGLCLDAEGPLGTLVVAGPSQVKWTAEVKGRAAHAGVAPEKGISAIRVAAQAVAKMPHGRIDEETTVNIGSFVGDGPTNIVCDHVRLIGEARSRDERKLAQVMADIAAAFQQAAEACGAAASLQHERMYDGFRFAADHPVRQLAETALRQAGFPVQATATGGGSDANILTSLGVPTINVGIGYEDIHTTSEHIRIQDIVGAARVALAFCTLAYGSETEIVPASFL
ncbi:hypothetical protein GCM10010885_01650 [Alicyclobacillus cellulosilyticus]|uniref:Peptidase M20 dimerisation domain-containing protein n=1 Tax=Alicyclobacillus cellulosilyticus TaxID=1003997 RepID=A0A917K143_9BACL|nr:M20/M25/M40 family metallo-hydrolase [Alicyclobacillus cellulosilyticus]GGI95647.1 hypothetical protein GCM10010885_01650 [Alicyclobacillus cellulosilyticus]